MSGTDGTKINLLSAATTLTNADGLLVVQTVSSIPTARLATIAQLRATILGNTTEAFIVASNPSTAADATSGLTINIAGVQRGNVYGARVGTTNEMLVVLTGSDAAGVLTQFCVLSKTAAVFSGLISCVANPTTGTALVAQGRSSDNIAAIRLLNFDSRNSYSLFASTASGFSIANSAGTTIFHLQPTTHNLALVSATVQANPTTALMVAPKQYVDATPTNKVVGSSTDWSGSTALSTTAAAFIDIAFPGDVAGVFVHASSLGVQGDAAVNSILLEVQIINAASAAVSTNLLGIDAGASGNGNYMNAGGSRMLAVGASTTGWKVRFLAKAGGAAAPTTLTNMTASALFILR